MKMLSIDIETFSDVDLSKSGVYPYAESPYFQITLFGYSIDGQPPKVIDLALGEHIPDDVLKALTDEKVIRIALHIRLLCKLHAYRQNRSRQYLIASSIKNGIQRHV